VVDELILNADKHVNDICDQEEVKKMGLTFLAGKKEDVGNIDESGVAPNKKGAQGCPGSVVFFNTKCSRAGSSMVKSDQTGALLSWEQMTPMNYFLHIFSFALWQNPTKGQCQRKMQSH
jgi:hypothetical protein